MSEGKGQIRRIKAEWNRRWRHFAKKDFYHQYFFAQTDSIKNIERIADQLSLKHRDRILEIGCGRGVTLALFTKIGMFAVGIDFSSVAIKRSKENFKKYSVKTGALVLADANFLPFKKKYFNAVYSFGTFEHFINPKKALNEMKRVSRGVVHISIPSKLSLMPIEWFFGSIVTKSEKETIVWYTKTQIQRLFLEVRLNDVDIWKSNVLPSYGTLKFIPFLKPYTKIILRDFLESFFSAIHFDRLFGRTITVIGRVYKGSER